MIWVKTVHVGLGVFNHYFKTTEEIKIKRKNISIQKKFDRKYSMEYGKLELMPAIKGCRLGRG